MTRPASGQRKNRRRAQRYEPFRIFAVFEHSSGRKRQDSHLAFRGAMCVCIRMPFIGRYEFPLFQARAFWNGGTSEDRVREVLPLEAQTAKWRKSSTAAQTPSR